MDENDNLFLRLLRDIRAKLDEHDDRFSSVERQLEQLNKKIEDWQETTATGLGFAAHANMRVQVIEAELETLRGRVDRLESTR